MIDLLAVEEPKPKPAKVHRRSPEARLRPLDDSAAASKRLLQQNRPREDIPLGLRGAAIPANHSTEIYWFGRSAEAVAMYFE